MRRRGRAGGGRGGEGCTLLDACRRAPPPVAHARSSPLFPLQVCLVGTVVRCGNIDDHKTFILEVMARLRARFPACVVVFIPESNLGNEAAHLERYVTNDSAVFTLREGGQGRFGVCKTETSTLEMYSTTRTLLAARNLFVDEACIGMPTRDECVRKRMAGGSAAARTFMLDKLRRQLHQYRWEDKNAATAANSTRDRVFRLTGKRSRQNDDLTIALSMALHYRRVFWANVTNPVYHAAKVAMGVLRHGSGAPMPLYRAPAGASQADAYAAVLGRT